MKVDTLMREALVVFSGNELTIGTILAGWLFGIAAGAASYRFFSNIRDKLLLIGGLFLIVALLLPWQVYALRVVREIFGVPAGEYASFGIIMAGSFLLFLPGCFCLARKS